MKELMALYLLYGIVSITRRFKLNELLVLSEMELSKVDSGKCKFLFE